MLLSSLNPAAVAGGHDIEDAVRCAPDRATLRAHLAKLNDLQSLSLAGTKVTDAGLAQLAGLSSLENLDLKGLAITDRGLAELAPVKSLKHVYVSRTGPTSAGIDALEQAIPRLHVTRQ